LSRSVHCDAVVLAARWRGAEVEGQPRGLAGDLAGYGTQPLKYVGGVRAGEKRRGRLELSEYFRDQLM
jgi:hypothetical protein